MDVLTFQAEVRRIAKLMYYSVHDLPAVTSPRWEARYEAHVRTIEVDVDVIIPEVDYAPVITVRRMPPLTESVSNSAGIAENIY